MTQFLTSDTDSASDRKSACSYLLPHNQFPSYLENANLATVTDVVYILAFNASQLYLKHKRC